MTLRRLLAIQQVAARYRLDQLIPAATGTGVLRLLLCLSPNRWLNRRVRAQSRGERIRRALEELGPVFVKLGQIVSTRRDLLPDDIADELAKLQDQVPPFSSQIVRTVVEAALGKPIDALFTDFSTDALASASVAQVHAARLKSGDDVVVKILRPGISGIIRRDIALMYTLANLVERYWPDGPRLRPHELIEEFERTIFDELDLVREAANAAQLRRNFASTPILYIPAIHWDYTRKNVLVMERIEGLRVSEVTRLRALNIDMQRLAERGVEIFFTQVFRDNFFHADMHPGNIFVDPKMPDDPRYIAVDFGIVGTLARADQRYLAENLLAFFNRDYRRVAQLHVDSGWVPVGTRVEEFESAIRTVCEPIFEKPLAEISFGQVLLRLFQTARRFDMPVQPQLLLLQKTLLNIEGLGRQLYPQLNLWETAKPFLEQWVNRQQGPLALLRQLGQQMPEWANTLPEVPSLLHTVLQKVAAGTAPARHRQLAELRAQLERNSRRSVAALGGVACLLAGVLIYGLGDYPSVMWAGVPALAWLLGGTGVLVLLAALR